MEEVINVRVVKCIATRWFTIQTSGCLRWSPGRGTSLVPDLLLVWQGHVETFVFIFKPDF